MSLEATQQLIEAAQRRSAMSGSTGAALSRKEFISRGLIFVGAGVEFLAACTLLPPSQAPESSKSDLPAPPTPLVKPTTPVSTPEPQPTATPIPRTTLTPVPTRTPEIYRGSQRDSIVWRIGELRSILNEFINDSLLTDRDRYHFGHLTERDDATLSKFWRESRIEQGDIGWWNINVGPDRAHKIEIETSYESAGVIVSEIKINVHPRVSAIPELEAVAKTILTNGTRKELPLEKLIDVAHLFFRLPSDINWYESQILIGTWREVRGIQGIRGTHVSPEGRLMTAYVDTHGDSQLAITEQFHNPTYKRRWPLPESLPPPKG